MNGAKRALEQICKTIESYLELRSKKEMILIFILCFLLGFIGIFSLSFERTKQSLEAKNQKKLHLQKELLDLQESFNAPQDFEDTKSLQDSIHALEQKIAQQDKQKNLLQNQSSIYALTQIADSKNLQDFTLTQENQKILLSAKGKYADFFSFLESLEAQSYSEISSLSLYPNTLKQHLEFYLEILLHKQNPLPNRN
ncbi:hypothetical protein [Helicobacter sp. UBA3407]|uniref:hypothetical protein n=1 Tax=Helicobacter TaxID=209 RepID=UPI002639C79B|nr:hypothetical protein [Helicobacter sp. UBA3407]